MTPSRACAPAPDAADASTAEIFGYLDHFAWWRIVGWLRKRHLGLNWGVISHRYLPGWEIRDGRTKMFRPRAEVVTRYRHRGTQIPTPWARDGVISHEH